MKKTMMFVFAALLAVGLTACQPASAADYTYVGASYNTVDVRDASFDSYTVSGSVAVGDNLFLRAGYTNAEDADLSLGTAKVGVGYRDALTKNIDLYGVASAIVAVDDRADFNKYTYEAEAGVRAMLTDRLEVRGGVIATDLSRSVEYFGTAGAEFAVTKNIRVGADLVGKEDVLGGQVGVRLYF